MNPISRYWLTKRHRTLNAWLTNSTILDIGSRSEKLTPDSIGIDLQRTTDIQADGCHLPIRSHSIDTIILSEVIEHLNFKELQSLISESKRTSSHIILSTPNADSLSWLFVWFLWSRTIGRTWHDTHIGLYCKEFLDSFIEANDITIKAFKKTRWSLFYDLQVSSQLAIQNHN